MRCPKCDFPRMKNWEELSSEEKFLAERLSASTTFSLEERKRHSFCPRCLHEELNEKSIVC